MDGEDHHEVGSPAPRDPMPVEHEAMEEEEEEGEHMVRRERRRTTSLASHDRRASEEDKPHDEVVEDVRAREVQEEEHAGEAEPVVSVDTLASMTPHELRSVLEDIYQDWCSMDVASPAMLKNATRRLCNTTDITSLTPENVSQCANDLLRAVSFLMSMFEKEGMLDPSKEESKAWLRQFSHIKEIISFTFGFVHSAVACRFRVLHPQQGLEMAYADILPWIHSCETEDKLNANQMLRLFLLNQALMNNYRRSDGYVYEEIFLESGHSTHAWKPKFTFKEFIHRTIDKDSHWNMWKLMTNSANTAKYLVDFLEDCEDKEFPRLKRDRRYHSFRNGVYDTHTDTFMPWGHRYLTGEVVACRFHDVDMPEEIHQEEYRRNPSRIPTPLLDMVFSIQGIEGEVYQWAVAWAMGRLLYRMGDVESNQRNGVLLIGHGGSGKSTIAKVVRNFFEPTDTGQINSNCEPKYALANVYGKYIWMCTEMKANMQLDLGMMQEIMEGKSRITIQKKNVTAFTVDWDVPGLLCGNELPVRWIDVGNAMERRFLIIEFPNKPPQSDPLLDDKLELEKPFIMVKANRFYRDLAERMRLGGGSMDDYLPEYYRTTLERFQKKTQPFVKMLTEHPELEAGDTQKIMLVELKAMFSEFLKLNRIQHVSLDEDEMIRQLRSRFGPECVRTITQDDPVHYDGQERHGVFVYGIGRAASSFGNDANSIVGFG